MTNWKTSLAGALAGGFFALQNYSGANTWQGYLIAFTLAVGGLLAKDYDTHSTVAQTQTATTQANEAAVAAINK